MAAYYDFFRKILLQPDGITLEADSVEDTLTITGGTGVSLNPNATTDSFTIDVDYQLYVPPGTTDIRLQDVKSAFTGVTLNPGSNIAITRNSNSELTITATVGAASKSISNITQASPAVLTTTNLHEFTEGSEVTVTDVVGMTQVNGEEYFMDVLTGNTVALYTDELLTVPLDSTGFTAYASGGVATADYSSVRTLSELRDVNATSAVAEDILVYRGGIWIPSSNIIADISGSVFSDDSSVLVDAVNSKHYGTFVGDLTGNVTGTITSIANHTTTNLSEGTNLYYTDVRADARIAAASITDLLDADQGVASTDSPNFVTVTASVTGNLTGNAAGAHTGTLDGDVTGSVFADDSTILVDGVAGTLHGDLTGNVTGTVSSIANHTTANLTENTNLYYTDVRADARITNAGSANWNTAFAWGNHASVGYHVAGTSHDGDVIGSVFGDDSSLLVDGINNRLVMANNTTDDLAEGSNNKYFTNGRAIAMTIVFG